MNNPVVRFVASMVLALTWVIAWQQILYAWFFRAFVAGVAVLAGLMVGPMLMGKPLLTVFKLQLGAYTLSSTTIFDVAMFLAVSGAMLAAFTQMKEPTP